MTEAANPQRGEVDILLDGKSYPMRPSYETMVAIEKELGSLMAVARRFRSEGEGGITIREAAVIVTEGVKAAGKARKDTMLSGFQVDVVGRKIFEAGLLSTPIFEALANFLSSLLVRSDPKKAEAVETPLTVVSTIGS